MRTAGGLSIALVFSSGLFAQAVVRGGFGNVVFPGGTSSTVPGIQRSFGNVVFPGGGGPQSLNRPAARHMGGGAVAVPYAVPVYPGGYYDNSYAPEMTVSAPPPPQPQQQQPNVIVVYPPPATPVIINVSPGDGSATGTRPPAPSTYQPVTVQPPQAETAATEPTHYLIAFKDHTIYAAVAYWVEGDTLHYFTSGNTHNQASLALIDRELTERLNKGSGAGVKLPAGK